MARTSPSLPTVRCSKRIRAELKEAKGPLTVSLGELETSALEAALKSYVDVGEREIATDMNKPFLAEMELAKMICEAMRIEFGEQYSRMS